MKSKKQLKIKDLNVEYVAEHRDVKYPRLEIKTDILHVILPEGYNDPSKLIKKHERWVYNKLSRVKSSQMEAEARKLDLGRSDDELKEIIHDMVESYSHDMAVQANQVRFRRMKTRWGSCSSKGNLNFNIYLKYLPVNLIEYIVFHELAHLIELSHNRRFKNIIFREFPGYKELEDELFIYWLKVKEHVGI